MGIPGCPDRIATAKALCAVCPLLDTCRDWALDQPADHLHGIWGGTTYNDRRRRGLGHRQPQPEQFRKANQRKAKEKTA